MSILPTKYRKGNSCNYEKSFETYIINNFGTQTYQTVLPFIKELSQLRNMVSSLQTPKTKEEINKQIALIVSYISYLDNIKNIISFGKEKNQMSLSFSWTEVTTGKTTTSNSIDYEICSVKYNLAVAFLLRAELVKNSRVDTELKEAMKDYQKASGVFQDIKDLYLTQLVKEGIPDFTESYIEMNMNYCFGMGNKCIFDICIIKSLDSKLISKQAMGAYYFFNRAAVTSISVPFDKIYYIHLSNLYKGLGYYHFFLSSVNTVIGKSKGMGLMIGFLEAAKLLLKESLKEQNKIKYNINSDLVENTLSQLDVKLGEAKIKNDKFFMEQIPPPQSLPEIEMDLTKMKAVPHDEQASTTEFIHLFNHLVGPEYFTTKNSFMKLMGQYVLEQTSKYHNKQSIEMFLAEKQLLTIGNDVSSNMVLSNELWNDIQEIQQIGGYDLLLNELKGLDVKANELKEQIQRIQNKLFEDDAENNKYRLLYGADWNIGTNDSYLKEIEALKSELSAIDNQKIQARDSIMNNNYIFSLLCLPRFQIESQLPGGNNVNASNMMTSTVEGKNLKAALDAVSKEQNSLSSIEKRISDVAHTPLQLFELQKIKGSYSAEKALFEEKKKLFDDLFKELESVHQSIQSCLEAVDDKYYKFKSMIQQQTSPQNTSSISSNPLTNIKIIYNEALFSVSNLMTMYSTIATKITLANNDSDGFIFAKNFNKEELIKILDSKARKNLAK